MFGDGLAVCRGTIALVVRPFIRRILGPRAQFDHEAVSGDLRDDRGGGHGCAVAVALHLGGDVRRHRHHRRVERAQGLGDVVVRPVEDRADLHLTAVEQSVAVDAELRLRLRQRAQCRHAERIGDAPFVDFPVAGGADGPGRAPILEFPEDGLTTVFRQHFGIGHALGDLKRIGVFQIPRPDGRRADHDRAGQRTASDLVEADDHIKALVGDRMFQIQRGHHGDGHQALAPSGTSLNVS